MSPRDFAIDFIRRWEDGGSSDPNVTHSLDPTDNGNWTGGRQGLGKLVGSNHGVTAAALAQHRGIATVDVTRPMMRALTVAEAADIALGLYYYAPNLEALPWNRVTASVMDMGWGAGPAQAIKLLQRLIGAQGDGIITTGGQTVRLYVAYIAKRGEAAAAGDYAASRYAFYDSIIVKRPANSIYRNGWRNRTAYYTPDDKAGWWRNAA